MPTCQLCGCRSEPPRAPAISALLASASLAPLPSHLDFSLLFTTHFSLTYRGAFSIFLGPRLSRPPSDSSTSRLRSSSINSDSAAVQLGDAAVLRT